MIDEEVSRILHEQETRARRLLEKHRLGLDYVALALLEKETIDGPEVVRLVQQGLGSDTPAVSPSNAG